MHSKSQYNVRHVRNVLQMNLLRYFYLYLKEATVHARTIPDLSVAEIFTLCQHKSSGRPNAFRVGQGRLEFLIFLIPRLLYY